jgi:hypothetical protein
MEEDASSYAVRLFDQGLHSIHAFERENVPNYQTMAVEYCLSQSLMSSYNTESQLFCSLSAVSGGCICEQSLHYT